jgi:hypothetical protein
VTGTDLEKGKAVRLRGTAICVDCLTPEEKAEVQKAAPRPTARKEVQPKAGPRGELASSSTRMKAATSPSTSRLAAVDSEEGQSPPRRRLVFIAAGSGGVLIAVGVVLFLVLKPGREDSRTPAPVAPAPTAVAPPKPAVPAPPQPREVPSALRTDLEALRMEISGPLSQNNVRVALAILDRAKDRHAGPEWAGGLAALEREIGDRARIRFKEIMDRSAGAAGRQAVDELRAARAEITGWGSSFEKLAKEFDDAFGGILAAAPAPTPAAPTTPAPDTKPPDPAAPPAPPWETARKYLESWQKAMFLATRRDYLRAASEVKTAGGASEEDVKKEVSEDLEDLRRAEAAYGRVLQAMAALPAWEEVQFEVLQEDGTRAAVQQKVLKAGPNRLELCGPPRFVEYMDIAPGSLARMYAKKRGTLPPDEARDLAILCVLDGDGAAARELLGGAEDRLPAKYWGYASTVRARLPAPDPAVHRNEWAARRLFYEAEGGFRVLGTRAAAVEKYLKLRESYADTEFMRKAGPEIDPRLEECLESSVTVGGFRGRGIFRPATLEINLAAVKLKVPGWLAAANAASDGPGDYAEFQFYALPGVKYRGWALVGGCCTATFEWYLQGSELTYPDRKTRKPLACEPDGAAAAPWEHKIPGLSSTHGGRDHAKAEMEPARWRWAELPIPAYATGGVKTVRLIGSRKGMAVAAALLSARRDKPPDDEETKRIAAVAAEEGPPTNALRAGPNEPDLLAQIPEARAFVLVYDLDLSRLNREIKYGVDNRAAVKGPFDRVAYLVELQRSGGPYQYVFVSMDAFTDDPGKVGIPEVSTGARFQQKVASMNVHSNVEGVTNGIMMDGGNIEFWSSNYAPRNSANVPGASGDKFDFGDQPTDPRDGYGSMQVHNSAAGHTVFALNHWREGGNADLGIGNQPGGNPDWTFSGSAKHYAAKRLRVLVRPRG